MTHDFEAVSGLTIQAAIAVHTALGPGFVEPVYQRAMEVSLSNRGISFQKQVRIPVFFEGVQVGLHRLDLVVGEELVVELKAIKAFEDVHYAQVRSYLRATGLRAGLLLNFNSPTLVIKRVVL